MVGQAAPGALRHARRPRAQIGPPLHSLSTAFSVFNNPDGCKTPGSVRKERSEARPLWGVRGLDVRGLELFELIRRDKAMGLAGRHGGPQTQIDSLTGLRPVGIEGETKEGRFRGLVLIVCERSRRCCHRNGLVT